MGISALKQKAKSITSSRSLKPDRLYMLYIFFLSITIVFLPLAYCVMREYYRYLRLCLKEYDDLNKEERKTKREYPYTHPTSIEFSFAGRGYMGALRALKIIFMPGVGSFEMPHLSYEQNVTVKGKFAELKMHYVNIQAITTLEMLFLLLIFFGGHYIISVASAAMLALLPVIASKFIAEYLQAYVILEKECREIEPESDTYGEEDIY